MKIQHLFVHADPERQTLHRRITPTAEQRAQQQERWHDVRDYLAGDLGNETGLQVSSWLQGSYKFGTQIRPTREIEFDIDLGIYLEWAGTAEDGPYEPHEVKSLVQQSLQRYAAEAEDDVVELVTPPKERCARIRFQDSFHIDVPGYHLDPARDARSLATEHHGWEDSDPKALYLWFRDQFADEDGNQVRRVIRYFKAWAQLNLDEPPSSILITVLVAEAYADLSAAACETDDVALQSIAHTLFERFECDTEVPNPVRPEENLNRLDDAQCEAFRTALADLALIADAALASATESAAAFQWSRAFQYLFPAPIEAASIEQAHALVLVAFDPVVRVEATPKSGGHTFAGINQVGPIPKDCSITFTLQNAGVLPAGASVNWMVRNEGVEAEAKNDLGHVVDTGLQATEHSAYRGTHYMDVVITSAFGAVLGYRRIPVRITGMAMPVRNPKRPGWTRFRRR